MAPPRAALVVDIDALVKRNPYKHRKAWLHHVELQQLSLVVVKNVVVQGIKVLAADTQPAIPTDDARELATFLWDHLKWPVAKDLLISSVARVYEHAFIVYYAPDDLVAARVVRGASCTVTVWPRTAARWPHARVGHSASLVPLPSLQTCPRTRGKRTRSRARAGPAASPTTCAPTDRLS